METGKKYKNKLRTVCEKGKFKVLLSAVGTTDELKHARFGPDLSQPLHYFAGRGNIQAVRELIEKYGCDPQCQNLHGITPLHCASYCGRSNVVKYLVDKCDVNLRDEQGVCPLGYTAYCVMKEVTVMSPLKCFQNKPRCEHVYTANFLLNTEEICATSNELCVLRLSVYCDSKFSVFMLMESNLKRKLEGISMELHCEIAKCLMTAIEESKWAFAENLLCTYAEDIKSVMTSDSGQMSCIPSCFHTACTRGDLEFISKFFQFNVCKPDAESVKIAIDRSHYELVSFLLKSADHPLLMDRYKTWSSLLSYVFECHMRDRKLVKVIVPATVSTNLVDAEGNSPLHLACKYPVPHIIEDYRCYQSTMNCSRELPLHIACKHKQFEILKFVSSQLEADINTQDLDGNTALHLMCHSLSSFYQAENMIFDCCQYLILDKKCDINIQNNLGELPLHILLKNKLSYYCRNLSANEWKELTVMLSNHTSFNINAQDSSGNTPIHIACMKNSVKSVLYLVSNFACNLNLTNEEGCLPLHYALGSKMPFEAIKAVSTGCTLKYLQNKDGMTPLHIACNEYYSEGDKVILVQLVSDTESINVQDMSGNTPLHYACRSRDSKAVLYLISNLHCDVNLLNHNQCLALHYALESKLSFEAIKAISNACTFKHVQNNVGKTPLHIVCEKHYDVNGKSLLEIVSDTNSVNAQDANGNTPLHISCKNRDDKSAFYLLLKLNCSVDIPNHRYCLALHSALMSHMPLEVIKEICIRCTLKHKQDEFGKTPLHIACENADHYSDENKKDLLELVGDAKSINVQDKDGNTPLHIVCKMDDLESALYLVSNCHCDVNLLNGDQRLPVHFAIKSCKAMEMVKIVSKGCILMHVQDKNRKTPLHLACEQKKVDVAKYLMFESRCFLSLCQPSAVYDSLDIRLACKAETDFPLLKSLANKNNVNTNYLHHSYFHDTGNTPLHVACTHHNLMAIELLVKFNCDLSSKDSLGRLPLHIACSKSLKCVEIMMPGITNDQFNVCDSNGDSPLHMAVKENHVDIVKFILLKFTCDLNVSNEKGELPLHMACTANSLEMIKILIENGASSKCNDQTKDGDSPLHMASRIGATDIVKYLVEACDCKPSMKLTNDELRLPVDYACKYSLEMVEIVSQSCSMEDLAPRRYESTIVSMTYAYAYRRLRSVRNRRTTLDSACCSGLLDIVMYLVNKRGCSLSALKNDHSALGYACGLMCDSQNNPWPDVVRFLICECGYDPSLSFNYRSVTQYACEQKNLELMKALTVNSVNIVDNEGNTPLHYASLYDCVNIAQFLLDHECDQTIVNCKGELAIHIACRTSLEITRLLTNCDIHSLNADGNTPLHIACDYEKEDIVKYLIDELKCDVNIQNGKGEYALHVACKSSLRIESLVQKSDINCQDTYGVTPLHIACYKCDYGMILFLLNQGCRADIPDVEGDLALHTLVSAKNSDSESYDRYDSIDEESVTVDVSQVLKIMLERNTDAAFTPNYDGDTPIDMAVMSSDIEFLDILFITGIEMNEQTKNRLLHSACAGGRSQSVRWLIDHGANIENVNDEGNLPQHTCFEHYCYLKTLKELGPIDISKQDINKNTTLHLACKTGRSDALQYILQSFNNCSECFSIQNNDKDTPLHLLAINHIYSPEVLTLIKCDKPNVKGEHGNTPLHLACQNGYIDLAKHLLISCRCNPNVSNDEGELPLHIAAAKSRKLVELLASPDNVNILCTKSGNTSLHIACAHYDFKIIQILIKFNCDRNIVNGEDNTALHIAAANSLEMVKLVASSKNINLQNKGGDTPLHIACRRQKWDTIIYLIEECECLVDKLNTNSDSAFHILLKNNQVSDSYTSWEKKKSVLWLIPISLIDKKNNDGDTLLHVACRKADEQTVLFILESLGCKLDAVNAFSGAAPLHFACYREFTKVVELSKSIKVQALTDVSCISDDIKFVSGDTPLHIACRTGNFDLVKNLLMSGHKEALNCCNVLKELPIHLACYQSKALIDFFSSRYCRYFDWNAADESGDTALHIVCRNKPITYFIKLLVKKMKCRVDFINKVGNLPLHIFCQGKKICVSIVRLLSTALSDDQLRLCNDNGQTALHELLKCPHEEYQIEHFRSILFQIFIKRGLLDIGKENGEEFLCLACRYQKLDIVKCLCDIYNSSSLDVPPSVLHEACLNTNQDVLEYILQIFKHDVDIPNANGDLPLHLAVRTSVCVRSTIVLIKSTKDVNHINLARNTPLHELYRGDKILNESQSNILTLFTPRTFCVYNYLAQVLSAFLDVADVNFSVQNSKGETPLHCMCTLERYDDLKIVLTQKSTDVNIQDKKGVTILHIACEANNYEAVRLIISSGADPSMKDNEGQAPITLTTDPKVIKVLTEHGADPQPLYAMHRKFFEKFSCEKPPPTPVILMVIGHPSVGKTTLIESLQNESFEKITSENFDHTAGVVPTNFNSLFFGEVTIYDLAGQPEYYASHDTVIHSTIKNVPPIVLIIVNLTESDKLIYDQLHYWINFIANRCAGLSDKAHMVVIGSHADILERDLDKIEVSRLRQSILSQLQDKKIILKELLHLNCTKSHSDEMKRLRNTLQKSTDDLRDTGVMHFNSHCFYVLLLQMFKTSDVVTLGRVTSTLKLKAKDSKNNPLFVLPSNRSAVIKLCQDLDEKGHLMFIEHPTIMDMSWLILNKLPLMNKIIGSLFAPADFPQHRPLSYSTGVVPMSRFDKQLCTKHNYPVSLSLTFLSRMEYCREITDKVVLESIVKKEEFSKTEKYFFFPTLVSLERPTDKWSTDTNFSYKCGWLIQCTIEGELFSPLFIQALLLRLAFSFTPKKIGYDTKDLETYKCSSESDKDSDVKPFVINRLCSVWNSGIYWQEESGVKTIVDVLHQRTLVLLMQCLDGCEIELVRRRSQIISMILNAKEEFCSEAIIIEYFMHPKCVTHPFLNLENVQSQLFSFPRVKATIVKKQPCVVNEHDRSVKLEDLLYFEPYSELSMESKKVHIYRGKMEQLSIFRGRQLPQGYGEAPSMSTVPRLHQLDLMKSNGKSVSVIRSAASKWKQLATRLHFEPSNINCIQSDNPTQCYKACLQVCNEWLSGTGRQPTSWTTLIQALEEAELSEVAKDLQTIISDTL